MEGVILKYLDRIKEKIKNENLVKHMICVGAIMFELAERMGENPEEWGAVGLLHDIDLEEINGEMSIHGKRSAEMVKDILSPNLLKAIERHNEHCGEKAEEKVDFALRAADGISGLIVACALVVPSKKLDDVKVESVLKKFKVKDFARNVSREKIMECEKIGLSVDEFAELAIDALMKVRSYIGI